MEKYDRRLKVVSQTVVWQRDEAAQWERHLLRHLTNGAVYWTPLRHVLVDAPCCLVCLSHRVTVEDQPDRESVLHCHECGANVWFV
jgi:hypothetical protein